MDTWLYGQYSIRTKLPHEISVKLYFMIGLWLLLTGLFRGWQIFAMYKQYVDTENASMHDLHQFISTNKKCCLSTIIKVGELRPWSINDGIFLSLVLLNAFQPCSKLLWIRRFDYCRTKWNDIYLHRWNIWKTHVYNSYGVMLAIKYQATYLVESWCLQMHNLFVNYSGKQIICFCALLMMLHCQRYCVCYNIIEVQELSK